MVPNKTSRLVAMWPELKTRPQLAEYLETHQGFRRLFLMWLDTLNKIASLRDKNLARTLFDLYYKQVRHELLSREASLPHPILNQSVGFLRNRKLNLEKAKLGLSRKRRILNPHYVLLGPTSAKTVGRSA